MDTKVANLAGADLTNATGLQSMSATAFCDESTDFSGTGFDPVTAGRTPLLPSVPTLFTVRNVAPHIPLVVRGAPGLPLGRAGIWGALDAT